MATRRKVIEEELGKASSIVCCPQLLAKSGGRWKMISIQKTHLLSVFVTLLWLRDQINFYSLFNMKRRAIIYKGQLQRGALVPDIIH